MESDCQTGNKYVFPLPFSAELQPACLPARLFSLCSLTLHLHEGFPFSSGGGPLFPSGVLPSPPLPSSLCPGLLCCAHVSARIIDHWLWEGNAPSLSRCVPHTRAVPRMERTECRRVFFVTDSAKGIRQFESFVYQMGFGLPLYR